MNEISIFGLDLAKSSFQVHGAAIDGTALVRKKLSRDKVLEFSPISLAAGASTPSVTFQLAHHRPAGRGDVSHQPARTKGLAVSTVPRAPPRQ